MSERIQYENLILNLYLFSRIKNRGNMFAAKLFYLFEEDLFKKRFIGPKYKMIKFQYGPYNNRIRSDLIALAKNNFLKLDMVYYDDYDLDYNVYFKNKNTQKFLKEIDELIQENSIIFNRFDDILNEFGHYNGKDLKKYIYSLEKTGKLEKKIEEYEMGEVILDPCDLQEPKFSFKLEEDWYDTIEILLDPKLKQQLQNAIEEVQHGNFTRL